MKPHTYATDVATTKKGKNGPKQFWHLGKEDANTERFDISENGELVFREGNYQYNIHKIIEEHGSPTEIFFPDIIEQRVRHIIEVFRDQIKTTGYKGKYNYHFPMKVNQNKECVLTVVAEGADLEVSSANELFLVKRMIENEHFHKKIRVICNGPKTESYISLIEELRERGLIVIPVIEDRSEYERLQRFKGEVGIRVDLKVKIDSYWDKEHNRFGFSESELLSMGKIKNLSLLHYHLSSQVEHIHGFVKPLKRALKLYAAMRVQNPGLDTLNIGGGAGVPYNKKKRLYKIDSLIRTLVKTANTECEKLGVKHPNLITEWGRYAVAPAQITIYKIIAEKEVHNKQKNKWYVIDGSFMNDLCDTWALHHKWHIVPVNHLYAEKLEDVWLAGSSCDSDDKYTGTGAVPLPALTGEDLCIAAFDTGAYQDALASHHCLLSSPLKLMARSGEVKVIRERETAEDVGKLFGW